MRAAAILGPGCSLKDLKPFHAVNSVEWSTGVPAAPDHPDVILLFGGDGTIHRHLGLLVRLGLPVLVVPAGSGNDFARALGLSSARDSLAAWKQFCRGRRNVREIDLGVIGPDRETDSLEFRTSRAQNAREIGHPEHPDPQYFCCVAGVGLDAEVSRRANHLPRWLRAHGGYALSVVPAIFQSAPVPMRIFASDGPDSDASGWTTRSNQPSLLAAFANTPHYGGGMKIAPLAKMDDGLLDVCVVGSMFPFRFFCMFPTVYGGRHLNIKEVKYFQAPRTRIQTETPLQVYADGEYVCQTPAELGVEQKALKVITP